MGKTRFSRIIYLSFHAVSYKVEVNTVNTNSIMVLDGLRIFFLQYLWKIKHTNMKMNNGFLIWA